MYRTLLGLLGGMMCGKKIILFEAKKKARKKKKRKQSLNPRRNCTSAFICIQHLAPLVMTMQVKGATSARIYLPLLRL